MMTGNKLPNDSRVSNIVPDSSVCANIADTLQLVAIVVLPLSDQEEEKPKSHRSTACSSCFSTFVHAVVVKEIFCHPVVRLSGQDDGDETPRWRTV